MTCEHCASGLLADLGFESVPLEITKLATGCLGEVLTEFDEDQFYYRVRLSDALKSADLVDTVRHEAAHLAHLGELEQRAIAKANMWVRLDGAVRDTDVYMRALRAVASGTDSSHGPRWRELARRYGATPKARS